MSEVVPVDVLHAALGLVVRQQVGDARADGSPGDRLLHLIDRRQVAEIYVVRGHLLKYNKMEICHFLNRILLSVR